MGRKTTHKTKSRKRGPVRSKKVTYDGITFASGLERYMYQALKKSKIKAEYEPETFVLQDGFMCDIQCYERQSNGKGDMVNRGEKKILPIKYTPDFIGNGFIIETKGIRTPEFKMRFKLFLKHLHDTGQNLDVYVPSNQKEVDITVDTILGRSPKK